MAEIRPDPNELGCPLFDEKEPCKECEKKEKEKNKDDKIWHLCHMCNDKCDKPDEKGNLAWLTKNKWVLCRDCAEQNRRNHNQCDDCREVMDRIGNEGHKGYWVNGKKVVCPSCSKRPENQNNKLVPYEPNNTSSPHPNQYQEEDKGKNKGLSHKYNYTPWLIGGAFVLVILAIIALAKSRD